MCHDTVQRRLPAKFSFRARFARALSVALIGAAFLCSFERALAADDEITPEEARRGYRARTLLAKPRSPAASVESAESAQHVRLIRSFARFGGLRVLESDGQEEVETVIKRLAATGLYEYVEPDYIRLPTAAPNDPRFAADQWSLANTGQSGGTAGADIKAAAAWDIQREAPDVIVAVLDTGVLTSHEDIAANLWQNTAELNGRPGVDDDGNGFIDDINGINATVARTAATSGDPTDAQGHGSHVAGIIGAVGDNGRGVAGIAWKVKIMPLKFMTARGGTNAAAVTCIDYAIANRAQIINASYGSLGFSQAEFDAIKRARDAGILFVAAAGNDALEISDVPHYPAAYGLDNIVAVASTTRQDKLASYSTFGSGIVDLAAPGSSILSLGITDDQTYATLSGTSMAAPHVVGAFALLKARFPNDNHRALINRLLSSVDVLPDLENRVHTNGRLNLLAALNTTHSRPFNDDFARRAVITGSANVVRGSNQFATSENAEPNHGVAGTTGTLWWTWTAPDGTGKATITTAGSGIDTVLAVYAAPAGATLGSLQRVAFNDDTSATVNASSITFDATERTTYAIAVAGKGGAEGYITFNLTSVPMNDMFSEARTLSGPAVVVEANNGRATGEPGEPRGPVGTNRTVWYKWQAPLNRTYQISAHGKSTDPVVAVYTGTAINALSRVAFDDDSGPYTDSLVRMNATAGVTYYISVDSYARSGLYTLSITDAAWQYVTDDEFYSTPALAADGTLYAVDAFGIIHAVSPNGERRWWSEVEGYVDGGAIAVSLDSSTLYVGDSLGVLYAFNSATGIARWSYKTAASIWAAPAIAEDGTVYVKSDDDFLHAIAPEGTLKWKLSVPGDTYASPIVGTDGTVYIASDKDAALYAITPTGTVKWRTNLGATIYASPALGADGTLFVGNYDGRFFAIAPDGVVRWQFDTGSPLSGSAVIDARGTVYFGSYNKKLYALDAATGAKKWEYATGDIIRSTAPVIADDGTIYIGSDDRLVHALNPDGTLQRTYATTGAILAAPLLSAGRLYVASTDAKLYAFDTGNNLARSPWPMHRHNLRRWARATEVPGIPSITTQPTASTRATAGAPLTLSASAAVAGGGAVTYQWLFNDAVMPGATSATLAFPLLQGSDAGTYRVLATGPGGSVISTAANVTVNVADTSAARLSNLAVRTSAGSGNAALFVGFAVAGPPSGSAKLLIRAIGPALGVFGVSGVLADPKLQIFSGNTMLRENDDWGGNSEVAILTPQVGAFALASATSKDAALVSTHAPGSYTAQVSGVSGSGVVLAEIYDGNPTAPFTATTPRLVNVSARAQVGVGGDVLIAGFSITGATAKRVLVRAIGPTLGVFGVPGALTDPRLDVFQGSATRPFVTNDNWGQSSNAAQIAAMSGSVGAFALALESRDAVLLLTLDPGTYSAQVSGVNNTTGSALVEVYELP